MNYISITIGVTLLGACAVLLPIDPIYRVVLTEPAVAIESIMACRVFRKTVLGTVTSGDRPCASETIVLTTLLHEEPDVEQSRIT